MAHVVAGFGSGHTPLMSVPGELWGVYAQDDPKRRELVQVPTGQRVTYDQLLASADPQIEREVNEETFVRKFASIQQGLRALNTLFDQVNPDVVVMFGDDQSELLFDDNYPMISVYWGSSMKILPRQVSADSNPALAIAMRSYGEHEVDYPIDSELGLHIIESLVEQNFDVAQSRYLRDSYGGSIGPATWYLDSQHTTRPRPFGMPHAFSYPVTNWFAGKTVPIVPITINTCYPPTWIGPSRAYALGRAVRRAVETWATDKKVAFACSGGLSHFVVDEEIDRRALKGMAEADADILCSLPRKRLQSATTEILNWVATAGAMGETKMEVLCYEAGYRTPAGTGCGCGCGAWI